MMTTLTATTATTTETATTTAPVLLSVIIPAYNESRRVGQSLQRIIEHLSQQPYRCEVLLVDDGSKDGTVDVCVEAWEALSRRAEGVEFRLLRNDQNRGKGFSVRQGMLMSRGEWVLFTDADLSSPIDQLDRLFAAAREEGADIAIGSRSAENAEVDPPSFKRRLMSVAFSQVVRVLGLAGYTDTQCGFKLYRRAAAQAIASLQRTARWSFDVEHLLVADRLGYQVVEVGVRWQHRDGSKVQPIRAALGAVWDLVRMRWAHRRLGKVHRPVEYGMTPSYVRIGNRVYQTSRSWWSQMVT